MFKILVTPNSKLLEKSSPVTLFDRKLAKEISKMKKTLSATRDPVGVGLAAPQVGIFKRMFIARPQENGKILTFINPEIITSSGEKKVPSFTNSKKIEAKKPAKSKKRLLEGCLSVPNIWGNVARKKEIKLRYQDVAGKENIQNFSGFDSTIIQHELDHLNGILFTKHVLEQKEQLYRSYKNAAGEDEFEEIEV
ncbi:MAG: hypothetical protein A3C30_01435 [Candidatus Levybacteria bacterium RIFCSPHIGHO2_02_FULL_40_18]|nr:MAG: hypothetical protein A2869_01000 [Candidatus Levybacteria bacterium RIFCSPHIGHO2_01_FULL_40_58]OGH26659.1 MAG: hypothetical protein A3C30_01435 [Candidatus Levybacteria bacterium RIFCSPHIGHO2_02_FULL_40_18]OGH31188.1 MAG: hypothetical protein A3E43_00270 [Candidatus Levybacteria bacterium RIFCSPHIGHO2_12_FULL_40_31]OGH39870.1 MAG: hypothetical protein A2894_03775 [Candidatus Levybacteria bacterium RIFCSPLOWO2_01_FULL_40_64]OGH48894.1 MAG: hypothetical protein A3I54_04880 [Candidatus Lev